MEDVLGRGWSSSEVVFLVDTLRFQRNTGAAITRAEVTEAAGSLALCVISFRPSEETVFK